MEKKALAKRLNFKKEDWLKIEKHCDNIGITPTALIRTTMLKKMKEVENENKM